MDDPIASLPIQHPDRKKNDDRLQTDDKPEREYLTSYNYVYMAAKSLSYSLKKLHTFLLYFFISAC